MSIYLANMGIYSITAAVTLCWAGLNWVIAQGDWDTDTPTTTVLCFVAIIANAVVNYLGILTILGWLQ